MTKIKLIIPEEKTGISSVDHIVGDIIEVRIYDDYGNAVTKCDCNCSYVLGSNWYEIVEGE